MTDYLIVGGGSAGCVLANRLSAAGAEVVLLEAGVDTPPSAVPEDIVDLYPRSYYNDAYMWPGLEAAQSAHDPAAKSRFPQARVMGGGSSLMGMIAVRGNPDDYDGWVTAGAQGWGWSDVLPYFRRLETDWDHGGPLHGADGPVVIRRHRQEDWPPFCRAIGDAVGARGWPVVADMNADFADGYCALPLSAQLTSRVSSASAYLDAETRRRPNLTIAAQTTVEHLLFEGDRCVGVSAIQGGARQVHRAAHVIVATGAIHSPALLMRSGVGSPDQLNPLGIPVVAPLEQVGRNLQNHPVVYLATHVPPAARQSPLLRPQFVSALRYSSGDDEATRGDLVLYAINKSSWHGLGEAVAGIGVSLMRPRSRGSVRLVSADPATPPDVDFHLLHDGTDRERMIQGLRLAVDLMQDDAVVPLRHELFAAGYGGVVRRLNQPGRRTLLATKALAALLDGPPALRRAMLTYGIAGGDVDEQRMRTPQWLAQTVGQRTFGTYHPAGTCRMGAADDPGAVLDPHCRVRETQGLSVVDASVMPTLVRGNTNIPVIMLAERAADLLIDGARR